jgi:dUTPase
MSQEHNIYSSDGACCVRLSEAEGRTLGLEPTPGDQARDAIVLQEEAPAPQVRFVIAPQQEASGLYEEAWRLGVQNRACDTGVDLRLPAPARLPPGETTEVPLGVAVRCLVLSWNAVEPYPQARPIAYEIRPRSSISKPGRRSLMLPRAPRTVDLSDRGELTLQVCNLGSEEVRLERGDAIAQLVPPMLLPAEYRKIETGTALYSRLFGAPAQGESDAAAPVQERGTPPPCVRFFIRARRREAATFYQRVWRLGKENTKFTSALDLPLPEDVTLPPGEVTDVFLGVSARCMLLLWGYSCALPPGASPVAFDLRPASALTKGRRQLLLTNAPGLVDQGYTGELRARVLNGGRESVTVKRGEVLVQAVAPCLYPAEYWFVRESDAIFSRIFDGTARGEAGFGSTDAPH